MRKQFEQNPYTLKAKNHAQIKEIQKAGKIPSLRQYKSKSVDAMWHTIANELIELAKEHQSVFVVEDLSGKFQTRGKYGTTCYRKLIKFLTYKAEYANTPVIRYPILDKKTGAHRKDKEGNLRYFDVHVKEVFAYATSKLCHKCGEYGNRGKGMERKYFSCGVCGWQGDADENAAVNIARRGFYKKDDWEGWKEFHKSFCGEKVERWIQLELF